MLVWLVFAVLVALVVALVIWPLASTHNQALARAAYDRVIYRDQLREIDRDVERGVLTPAEATSARLEVERRLLASADAKTRAAPSAARPAPLLLTLVLAVLVPLGAISIYLVHGSPKLPDRPYEARAAERAVTNAQGGLDPDKTVAALQARLKAEPRSVEGWVLLARAQAGRQHWQESADAYRHALTLANGRTDIAAAYAEMLVMAADGIVTPTAKDALDAVVADDPKNPSARYYLALAKAQGGDVKGAIADWQALLAEAPADAPWAATVRQRIADTAKTAGLPVPAPAGAPASSGPSPDDVAAAAQLSPEQRNEMIRGMVARLAARLKDAPDDLQGWLHLGRAYDVLKEPDKAADAYAQAAKLKPADPDILASEVDAMMADRSPSDPIPESAIAVLKELNALDASEPRALWYLGLAAAQAHQLDEAKAYWQKLLSVLPPDSADRKMVSEALTALSN